MKAFTEQTGFVFTFLVCTLLLTMIFPPKTVEKILWLVLSSMTILNHEKMVAFIKEKGSVFTNE